MSGDGTDPTPADAGGAVPPPAPVGPDPVVPPTPVVPPPPVAQDPPQEPVRPPAPPVGTHADPHLAPPVGYAAASAPLPPSAEPDAPDQQWPSDAVISPYIGGSVPASGNYRVLTAVIMLFLVALLAGAIALIVYLAGHTTLSFPSADPDPRPVATEVSESATPQAPREETSPEPLTGALCTDLCVEVAGLVGPQIVGADGESTWALTGGWSTVETASLSAEEAVGADYRSDDGELTFTIWRFTDDDAAQDAQELLIESLGEPSDSGAAFQDGTGEQSTFDDGSQTTIVWSKLGDGSQPWVMQVHGTGAVQQFYYALPL